MKTIFYHRGRGGHRGYSEGSIFTHASDTDRLNVRQKKCGDFSLSSFYPLRPLW